MRVALRGVEVQAGLGLQRGVVDEEFWQSGLDPVESRLDNPTRRDLRSVVVGQLVLSEPRLKDERRWLRETIAQRLRREQQDGDLSAACDTDELAVFFDAVIAGMSARARDGASYPELKTTARLALSAVPPPDWNSDDALKHRPETAQPGPAPLRERAARSCCWGVSAQPAAAAIAASLCADYS